MSVPCLDTTTDENVVTFNLGTFKPSTIFEGVHALMHPTNYVPGLVAFVLALVLTPCCRWLSFRYRLLLDESNDRKLHTKSMPCSGGVAICLAHVLAVVIGSVFVAFRPSIQPIAVCLVAGGIGGLLGFYDDLRGMNAYHKLAGQLLVTLLLFASGIRLERMVFPLVWDVSLPPPLGFAATFFWVAATMNAINLLDGMDGSAAGVSTVAAITMAVLGYRAGNVEATLLAIGLAGACLGFLMHNFHPASIFMGDCGAMGIGAAFAALSLVLTRNGETAGSLWIPITILTVPFLDTTLAILRRTLGEGSLFVADMGHLHHQFLGLGLSQRQVALVLYVLSALMAVFAISISEFSDRAVMIAVGLIGICLLVLGWIFSQRHQKRRVSNVAPTRSISDHQH